MNKETKSKLAIFDTFKTKDGTYRLSIADCKISQGFPEEWNFYGPVYKVLGQIGNSVAVPVISSIASKVIEEIT